MRVINTKTYKLKEFFPGPPADQPYYILSHTWFSEEPTFQEWEVRDLTKGNPNLNEGIPRDPGVSKILNFCHLARLRKIQWVWVDTVCIDKKSSAELSEAINSMYRYYEGAAACYVYLSDVLCRPHQQADARKEGDGRHEPKEDQIGLERKASDHTWLPQNFRCSRWFTRGWTLQELIAPSNVEFFDMHWGIIGTKREMAAVISEITGIDTKLLASSKPVRLLHRYSIGTRMSWAANRQVTRLEDSAYSLLGLFGINMYLLYGEEENAFFRLQKKLLKATDDETLLAWSLPYTHDAPVISGILAPHPSAFADARRVHRANMGAFPLTVTNKGIRVPVFNVAYAHMDNTSIIMPLKCSESEGPDGEVVGVILTNLHGKWYRRSQTGILSVGKRLEPATLFSNAIQPSETLLVEITTPPQLKLVRMPLLTDYMLPTVFRFPHHFTDPVTILLSLDPWELELLARDWDRNKLLQTIHALILTPGGPRIFAKHLEFMDVFSEFLRLLNRHIAKRRHGAKQSMSSPDNQMSSVPGQGVEQVNMNRISPGNVTQALPAEARPHLVTESIIDGDQVPQAQ